MMTDCVDLMEERKCWRRREDERALFAYGGISVMMMKSHLYAIDIDKKKVQNTFFNTLEPLWKSALHHTRISPTVAIDSYMYFLIYKFLIPGGEKLSHDADQAARSNIGGKTQDETKLNDMTITWHFSSNLFCQNDQLTKKS